jgi:3-dehydroquinate synthase
VVLEDEHDLGRRMLLNFGHTLGHAYERAYHYETYTHGEAVAAGMCAAAKLGVELGVTPSEVPGRIAALCEKFSLPTSIPCSAEDYRAAVGLDKKGQGNQIHLIVLRALGQAEAVRLDKAELMERISQI